MATKTKKPKPPLDPYSTAPAPPGLDPPRGTVTRKVPGMAPQPPAPAPVTRQPVARQVTPPVAAGTLPPLEPPKPPDTGLAASDAAVAARAAAFRARRRANTGITGTGRLPQPTSRATPLFMAMRLFGLG